MSESAIPIFIGAGDPSGDIAGNHLIKQLQLNYNNIDLFGLGGARMRTLGQMQIVDGSQLAVLGFWEVAKKYRFFQKLLRDTVKLIEEKRPKIVILIDYPGFNLRLAEKIRHLKIPVVYYISPQIWAWAPKRIEQIKRLVSLMLLILPFETEIYNQALVPNKFVGHYLLDDMADKYIKAPYDFNSDLVTLMPGSRPQEVHRMLPVLLKCAELLSRKYKLRFSVAAVEGNIDYESHLSRFNCQVDLVRGKSRDLIAESRLVLTSSGTATLETGIIGRPMVVIYKTGLLTYLIARQLVKIDNIALINIVSDRRVVPELIQNNAGARNILNEASKFIEDKTLVKRTLSDLNKTTDTLGGPGCSERAVEALKEFIN